MSTNIDQIIDEIHEEKMEAEMKQIIESDDDLKFAFNHIDHFEGNDEQWNDFNTNQSIT